MKTPIEVMGLLPKETRERIRMIAIQIRTYIPSEKSNSRYENFINKISDTPPVIINEMIDMYNRRNYVFEMKGFDYLTAMIRRYDKDREAKLQMETKIFGAGMRRMSL